MITRAALLACLLGCAAAAPTATEIAAQRRDAVVNDPVNPSGMQIRRARAKDEAWADYFCAVYLWPYDKEHYNRTFTTLNQNGRRIQFIGNVVFASGGRWHLVLRGTKEMVDLMSRNVVLESGGPAGRRVQPVETLLREDPAGDAWIGLVGFDRLPEPGQATTMSAFALYGNAGGVHEVLDEEQARRKFAVIRSVVEFIERIYREQQRQKKR